MTFLIIVLIIIALMVWNIVSLNKQWDKRYSTRNNKSELYIGTYIGGLDDVLSGSGVKVWNHNTKLRIEYEKVDNNVDFANFNKINSIKIVSKDYIKEKVSLGKVLVFGVFALGMKDSKKIYENFIQIEYKDQKDRDKIAIIDLNEKDIREIINSYNKFKKENVILERVVE